MKRKVVIMGAAGRDFHNFNVFFRDNEDYDVVAFTAEQIAGISERSYPAELAGKLYPKGIPIEPEEELEKLIKENNVDEVVFAYHDLSNQYVMDHSAQVNAAGADFKLMGTRATQLKSSKPVVAVCAVRTGAGKSQTSRKIVEYLKARGKKVVVVRHPMPYGDLVKQTCQRFETLEDLDKHECTIEEREEYELHIKAGNVLYAGVDYEKILREAEKEADVILWDGGNNDFPFYKADLQFTVADPLRPGHELTYYAGNINTRIADVVVISKENNAKEEDIKIVVENVKKVNPSAEIVHANSVLSLDGGNIAGKRVLVVEDGPTTTHGGMAFGAGHVAAKEAGAVVVDPRPFAVGSIKETFENFPHLKEVLPAMGYSKEQIGELEETINAADCDFVVTGTPIDIRRILNVGKPLVHVKYELEEKNRKLDEFLDRVC